MWRRHTLQHDEQLRLIYVLLCDDLHVACTDAKLLLIVRHGQAMSNWLQVRLRAWCVRA
jgi:hypothetical protein